MRKANLKTDLQSVLENCRDSAEIYISAADCTKTEDLQNKFLLFALQRKNFAELLSHQAWKEGYHLSISHRFVSILHRYFRALIQAFSSKTDEKIIESCRASEEDLVNLYDEVLTNKEMPRSLYKLLVEHQQLIRVAMNKHLFIPTNG